MNAIHCPVCKTIKLEDVSLTTPGSAFECPKCGFFVYGTELSSGKLNVREHFFCDSDSAKIRPSCQDVKCENFAQCRPGFVAHRMHQLR